MKNLKIGLIMFAVMLVILLAPSVYATDINDVTTMSSVLTGSTVSGNTVTLNQNIDLGSNYLKFISGEYTLDLNGYTVSGRNNIVIGIEGGTLTFTDSSTAKNGKVICSKVDGDSSIQAVVQGFGGSIVFDGGTFECEDYAVFVENTVTVNKATFLAKAGMMAIENSNITINNGIFGRDDGEYGLMCYDTATINGGTYYGATALLAGYNSNVIIKGGTFGNTNSEYGARLFENARIDNGVFKGTQDGLLYNALMLEEGLTINGGTFGDTFSEFGLRMRGGKITINKGTFNADNDGTGIYARVFDSKAINLTINDATATSKDGYGMYLDVDNRYNNYAFNIKGGTYTGTYTGLFVYDYAVPYVKLSGGRYIATTNVDEDNYGGIHIWSRSLDGSERSIYTLSSLLKEGYNYSNTTFVEKLDNEEDEYYFTTEKNVFVASEKTITVKEGITNGTVTAKLKAVVGEEVALTVTPNEDYKVKSISVLDSSNKVVATITNNKFIMPNANVFIGAEFESIYEDKTISKTEADIIASLKGKFTQNAELVITKIEAGNAGYDSLITLIKDNQIIMGSYDVSVIGTYKGKLELTFQVGTQYNGNKITIYHKLASGEVETKTAVVSDGKVTITVDELSPFMLVTDKKVEDKKVEDQKVEDKKVEDKKDETPKTGSNDYIGMVAMISGVIFIGAVASIKNN